MSDVVDLTEAMRQYHALRRLKQRLLSIKEYGMWIEGSEHALIKCMAYEFNPTFCKPELELLAEEARRDSEIVWDNCLDIARYDLSDVATEEEIEEVATQMCCSLRCIPPHFTHALKCKRCGWMPCPKERQGMFVDACDFCLAERVSEESTSKSNRVSDESSRVRDGVAKERANKDDRTGKANRKHDTDAGC